MVRGTTFVSFVLLTGLVMVVGATGRAEDQESKESLRSSGLMTVAAPRKLSKNSKASKDDTAISEEDVSSLLHLLVFEKAVDVYRSMQPAPSLANDEDAATRADTNEIGGRELVELDVYYEKYACTGCVNFFMWVKELTPDEKEDFCGFVVFLVLRVEESAFIRGAGPFMEYCKEFIQCPFSPRKCCQVEGVCLKLLPS